MVKRALLSMPIARAGENAQLCSVDRAPKRTSSASNEHDVPILIWFAAGIAWGIYEIANSEPFWGISLLIVSALLVLPTFLMIVNRMDSNERREVREVLSAFLVGYKAGMFDKRDKDR